MSDNPLTVPQQTLPQGEFLLPLCVTKVDVQNILDAMFYARYLFSEDGSDLDFMTPVLEGLAFTQTPGNAPCVAATPEEGECVDYATSTAMLSISPADPRINPDYVPPGYNFPPFYFQPGTTRIVTSLERVPTEILTNTPELPRMRVSFNGAGTVEVHLVSIVLGGAVLLVLDDNPLTEITAELNRDLTSIPPELSDQVVLEMEATTAGAHHIDITFLPRINDEGIPLNYGGGIEKIVLCGTDIHSGENMASMQFQRKPGASDYTLQVKIGDGSWVDTGYSFKNAAINETNITLDVKDENGVSIGSFTPFNSPVNPNTQISNTNYTLQLNRSAFQGDDGLPGQNGQDGHSVQMTDPPSAVLDPNQAPYIQVDNALPSTTFIKAHLPRVPTFTVGDVLPVAPSGVPTVDFNTTPQGDVIVDFGLVKGDKGDTGAALAFDEVPPAEGDTKTYSVEVPHDGFVIPFLLKTGDVVTVSESAKGLWGATQKPTTNADYAMDATGITVGATNEVGQLQRGVKRPTDAQFTDFNIYNAPVTVDADDTALIFRQSVRAGFSGLGKLYLNYDVYRPAVTPIAQTFDFREATHLWSPVTFEERWSNEYGGRYAGVGNQATQGWYESANVFEGWNSTIKSPQFNPTAIHSVDVYWDLMNGNGCYLQVWGKPSNSGNWQLITNTVNINPASGNYLFTLATPYTGIEIAVTISGYAHSATTWRMWKVIVT